jgi:hypothetical protein
MGKVWKVAGSIPFGGKRMATSTEKWVTPIVLYLRRAHFGIYRQALACQKSCPKNGDVPKSSFLLIGSHGSHRQAHLRTMTLARTVGAIGT